MNETYSVLETVPRALDLNHFEWDVTYQLYCHGQPVGTVIRTQERMDVQITDETAGYRIYGGGNLKVCSIVAHQTPIFLAGLPKTHLLEVNGKQISILDHPLEAENIIFRATDEIIFREKIKAESIKIFSKNVFLKKNIISRFLEIKAEQDIHSEEDLTIDSLLKLSASAIENNGKIFSQEMSVKADDGIVIGFRAQFKMLKGQLDSKSILNYGDIFFKNSNLRVTDAFNSYQKIELKKSKLVTGNLELKGEHHISSSLIETNALKQSGKGQFLGNYLETSIWTGDAQEGMRVAGCQIDVGVANFSGDWYFERNWGTFASFAHSTGEITLSRNPYLKMSGFVCNAADSRLNIQDSRMNVQVDNNGKIISEKDPSIFIFNGAVKVSNSLFSVGQFHAAQGLDFKKSFLKSENFTSGGISTVTENSHLISEQMTLLPGSDVSLRNSRLQAEKDFSAHDSSEINGEDSTILGHQISLQGKTELSGSLKKSGLYAKTELNFSPSSESHLESTVVKSDQNIKVANRAKVTGKDLTFSAKYAMHNHGSMDINTFKVQSSWIDNTWGSIKGGARLELEAEYLFSSFNGELEANQTEITSLLSASGVSSFKGWDSLRQGSALNLGLANLYRGYDVRNNSLVSVGVSLTLPSLPSQPLTWGSVFSMSRAVPVSRVVLSNLVPSVSGGINLMYQAVPILYQGAPLLYQGGMLVYDSFYNKQAAQQNAFLNQNWGDLLTTKNALNSVLATKKFYVDFVNGYRTFQRGFDELDAFSWDKLTTEPFDFSWTDSGNAVLAMFGPTLSHDAFLDVDAGLDLTQNIYKNSFFSFKVGADVGLQSATYHTNIMQHHGLIAAGYQMTLTGNTLKNAGKLKPFGKGYLNFKTVENLESGGIDGSHTILVTEQLDNTGHIALEHSFVQVKNKILIQESGEMKLKNSTLITPKMQVEGYAEFKNDAPESSSLEAVDPPTDEAQPIDLEAEPESGTENEAPPENKNGEFLASAQNSEGPPVALPESADSETPSPVLTENQQFSLNIQDKLEVTETGTFITDHMTMKVGEVVFEGQVSQHNTFMQASNLIVKNELDIQNVSYQIEHDARLEESARISAENSRLSAQTIHHGATTTFEGLFELDAEQHLTLDQSGQFLSQTTDGTSQLHLRSSGQATLGGKMDVENLLLDVPGATAEQLQALIAGREEFSKYQISNSLGVKTNEAIVLDEKIDRTCGLNVEAASVEVLTDYHTEHDLRFKSTQSDVALYGNLSGEHLLVSSKGAVVTGKNIETQEAMVIEAEGTFTNLAGDLNSQGVLVIEAAEIKNIHSESQELQNFSEEELKKAGLKKHLEHIEVNNLYVHKQVDVLKDDQPGQPKTGSVLGREVYMKANVGDIENLGGTISATQYGQLIAKGSIKNIANTTIERGAYDLNVSYQVATLRGGTGFASGDEGNKTPGLFLHAENQVQNVGSVMKGTGDVLIQADQGFSSGAESNEYLWWYKYRSNGTVETETQTVMQKSTLSSSQGRVIIYAPEGKVETQGTDFLAKNGTQIHARSGAKLEGLTLHNVKTSQKSGGYWNTFSSSRTVESNASYAPAFLCDGGMTIIQTEEGDIEGTGVVLLGEGDFYASAPKGEINFSKEKLLHTFDHTSTHVQVSLPGLNQLYGVLKGDAKKVWGQVEPLFFELKTLMHSDGAAEWLLNSWDTAMLAYDDYEDAKAFIEAQTNVVDTVKEWAQSKINLEQVVNAGVGIDISTEEKHARVETLGPGQIKKTGKIILEAGKKVTLGVDLSTSSDLTIRAPQVEFKGQTLNSDVLQNRNTAHVTLRPSAPPSVRVSSSHSAHHVSHQVNQKTHVGGQFNIEGDQVILNGAVVQANSVTGHIDDLQIISHPDIEENSRMSGQLASSTAIAYSDKTSSSSHVKQNSTLEFAQEGQGSLTVNHVTFVGNQMVAEHPDLFHAQTVTCVPIEEYDRHTNISFHGNVNKTVAKGKKVVAHAKEIWHEHLAPKPNGSPAELDAPPDTQQSDPARPSDLNLEPRSPVLRMWDSKKAKNKSNQLGPVADQMAQNSTAKKGLTL